MTDMTNSKALLKTINCHAEIINCRLHPGIEYECLDGRKIGCLVVLGEIMDIGEAGEIEWKEDHVFVRVNRGGGGINVSAGGEDDFTIRMLSSEDTSTLKAKP